jgi:hypothetical protein
MMMELSIGEFVRLMSLKSYILGLFQLIVEC